MTTNVLPRFKLSDLPQFKTDAFLAIDGYVYNMTGFAHCFFLLTLQAYVRGKVPR